MVKLDHIRIAVKDYRSSRDWYVEHIGLKLEFEIPRRKVAAMRDGSGVTLLLEEGEDIDANSCVLYFQVDDVEETHRELSSRGIRFIHPPTKEFWGYGVELRDPSGYRIRLWDPTTMQKMG